MCGIAGLWSLSESSTGAVERACGRLSHRGPDGSGIWVGAPREPVLGHRRLAILDLTETGRQPVVSLDDKLVGVYNGELYNDLELRSELGTRGRRFRGRSDAETLLAAYAEWGLDCVSRLEGMFAFAIWDARRSTLLLVRDRLGKKPLYYACGSWGIAFASEIPAILEMAPGSDERIDRAALSGYLASGSVSGTRTIYEGVREVQPGGTVEVSPDGTLKFNRYWSPVASVRPPSSFRSAVEQTEQVLSKAVAARLRADVPIGVFLSGGIDSGLVAALATRTIGRLRTFTAAFPGSAADESREARRVASFLGTEHEEIDCSFDPAALLPRLVTAYGEPFADPSALPSFLVAELASRRVKVVLNGDGGDEVFCGYRRYLAAAASDLLRAILPDALLRPAASALRAVMPVPTAVRTSYSFLHRFVGGLASDSARRLQSFGSDGFSIEELSALGFRSETETLHMDGLSDLEALLRLDLSVELPSALLVKMDIATMAHGLEARSPFLDHRVVEWGLGLPPNIQLRGGQTKAVLRELAKRILPAGVSSAPKIGFEPPILSWLNNELKPMCEDVILSRGGLLAELFERQALESVLRGKIRAGMDPGRWARRLWILLSLGLWDGQRRGIVGTRA